MTWNQKSMLFFVLFCATQFAFCQVKNVKKEPIPVYGHIQNYSAKNPFTKMVYKLIFEPVTRERKTIKKENRLNYQEFENKIIRKINIVTLDPFGFSELDSTRKPKNWTEREGNRIHIKTKRLAILNLLLFKKNSVLDSLSLKESERLIRTQRYISSVIIKPELIENSPDSVDVSVRVLDTWSLIPQGSINNSSMNLGFDERNFIGTGHEFNANYNTRFSDSKAAYLLKYEIPNIRNTYIQTSLNYFIDLDGNTGKSLSIDRPFYSTLTKWAGGIYLDNQNKNDTLQDSNLVFAKQNFKFYTQDFWLGNAFKIFKGNSLRQRTTNLIVSARFLNINYTQSPTPVYDSIHFYSSEKFFLTGIGITSRKFIEDRYIFKNGIIEDVPIGRIYGITGGYQYKNNLGRYYLGGQASFGNFFKWGFLSTNFEMGTFFEKSKTIKTAFTFQANYFTNLFEIGKWKLRQFVKPQFILGINRENSNGDKLSINENYGIAGFNNYEYGNRKMLLTLQTQAYSPWQVWGFRLNPFLNYTVAKLGNKENNFISKKSYSKISLGFIINNDYLVFSNFQISLSYYPSIPNIGDSVFRTNSFETTDFGFQAFELAKPRTVIYK